MIDERRRRSFGGSLSCTWQGGGRRRLSSSSTERACRVRLRMRLGRTGIGRMDGWQHSTVVAILDNPRYTGYAIYGRWQKVEELLDPDDVAAGYVVKFRRSPQAKIVRSREPAHPAIVSVEMFTAAAARAAEAEARGGSRAGRRVDRRRVSQQAGLCAAGAGSVAGSVRGRWRGRRGAGTRSTTGATRGRWCRDRRPRWRILGRSTFVRIVVTPAINRWIGQSVRSAASRGDGRALCSRRTTP